MKLNLKNSIVFFDLETTGLNISKDRIVEISMLKITPDGKEIEWTRRVNPEMSIPQESSAIHGIHDEDVKDCPTFKQLASEIENFIEGCDMGGYNSNHFDIPMLAEEFIRAGKNVDLKRKKMVDVQVIFKKMEQRTLSAAYKFYCKQDLENAHSAFADVKATYEVLKAQLDRYDDTLENNIEFLDNFSNQTRSVDYAGFIVRNDKGEEVFNFGKNKGKSLKEVLKTQAGYFDWMLDSDFPLYTKRILEKFKLENSRMMSGGSRPVENKLF